MLATAAATADCTNHYSEQIVYESEWTENLPMGISWLNLLTAQSIPEETDVMDIPHTPARVHSESNCSSSSSIESCYVVLEIQRPRSSDEASNKPEEEEEEEEEEEMEEEIEELNFAHINRDDRNVQHDQLAISMTTESPQEEYVVEYQQELPFPAEEYAQVTEAVMLETPNDILFHKAKTLSRVSKRMKAMSYLSAKEQQFSTSSDDESLNITKLKTIRKINEYHPIALAAVAAEQQQQSTIRQLNNSSPHSTASLDSIENKCLPSSPVRTRITTTFSNLSSKRPVNPFPIQRPTLTMGTATLTRTFAFDRTCMERYGRDKGQINESIEIQRKQIHETPIKEEKELSSKTIESSELPLPSNDPLHHRSFNNTIPTPFYITNNPNIIDESEGERYSSISHSTSIGNNLSKASSILSSMKKYARTISSEYRLSQNNDETFNEPTLLQVKYLDGKRPPLTNEHARESFRKSQTLSDSISSRLNRLGLTKMASTQDLTFPTTSFNTSYRKRMLNRFRTFIENNSFDEPPPPLPPPSTTQTRPWQHKTITELFNERKTKLHRQS